MNYKHTLVAVISVATAAAGGATAITRNYSYGEDRAQIENLQARYMFALDWQDAAVYAGTFTEDGILDWSGGVTRGRDAIRADVHGMRAAFAKREAADAPLRPARLRHAITNVVIQIHGDMPAVGLTGSNSTTMARSEKGISVPMGTMKTSCARSRVSGYSVNVKSTMSK